MSRIIYNLKKHRWLTGPVRLRPDFLIIGGEKCGTSSLYRYLEQHPNIAAASRKEVHYFDLNFDKGDNWYRGHFQYAFRKWGSEHLMRQKRITGEASPYYLHHPHVPGRVHRFNPGMKLLVLLRDPVERTYSHYQHNKNRGHETLDIAAALNREEKLLPAAKSNFEQDPFFYSEVHHLFAYKDRSIYATQLENWFRHFPKDQFFITTSEEFYADPRATLGRVCEFLEVPAIERNDFPVFKQGTYSPMDPELRKSLEEYFRPHNRRLEQLLGMKFPW